ncbi:sensor histidine kinase [Mucilaginibacter panaciglaebae]|uniref:Histidine kinase n=1 Tax=Mucilaginibacter panaciglaebae TaxID=502331 RepID=A0ABP7X0N6_9SPHI
MKSWLLRLFSGKYLFHLIVWLVYGIYNLMNVEDYIHKKGWLFSLAPLAVSIGLLAMLIYVNAFLLIPKLLDKRKITLYLLSVLALVILNTYLKSLSLQYYDTLVWPKNTMTLPSYFKWNLFDSFWSILISTLLLFSLRWSQQNERVKNIEVEQLHSELRYLRAQLNPHFLFNGLNTIYGNIDSANETARNVLLQFSDLLRYNLYEADVDLIELGKEAAYLESYVALQRARSNANVAADLTINIADPGLMVAPLIFIAFVENAFKFITREDHTRNFVTISLTEHAGQVRFSCINSYEIAENKDGGGIGLRNVKRRLELLYPSNYQLDIEADNNIYSVNLMLTL